MTSWPYFEGRAPESRRTSSCAGMTGDSCRSPGGRGSDVGRERRPITRDPRFCRPAPSLACWRAAGTWTEAGWGLWAIGFPVTAWARALLLEELTAQTACVVRADRSLRKGKGCAGRRSESAAAHRATSRGCAEASSRKAMPRVLQMLVAYPLGTLRAEDYTEEEWAAVP